MNGLRVTRSLQFYTDKCVPSGERIVCVDGFRFVVACLSVWGGGGGYLFIYLFIITLPHGHNTPCSEDLFSFPEGGCCYAWRLSWLNIVPI